MFLYYVFTKKLLWFMLVIIAPVDQYGQGYGSSTGRCCPLIPGHLAAFCCSFQVHVAYLQSPKHTEDFAQD